MGHRLPLHNGLCKNLHGHSYGMEVVFTGKPNSAGMVMDYFDVSSLVRPLIDRLDHCFIADRSDTAMVDFLERHNLKVVVVDFPTTAENLAAYALEYIVNALPDNHTIEHIAVSIHETEKTSARVEKSLR